MPSTEAILWTGIASLILMMLAIIGYLLSTGFASIREQFSKLWAKFDAYQMQGEANAQAIAAINARCDERHANHKRVTDK